MIPASTQTVLLSLLSKSTAILNLSPTVALCHAAKKRDYFNRWRLVSLLPVAKCTGRGASAVLSLFHGLAIVRYPSSSDCALTVPQTLHDQSNGVNLREFKDRLAEGFNLTKHSRSGKARWVIAILHSASNFILLRQPRNDLFLTFIY